MLSFSHHEICNNFLISINVYPLKHQSLSKIIADKFSNTFKVLTIENMEDFLYYEFI